MNKQIIECSQILKVLREGQGGWANHPAVRMWDGHELALVEYAQVCFFEFCDRGGTTEHKSWLGIHHAYIQGSDNHFMDVWGQHKASPSYPSWLGNEEFHSSHRGRLLHKGNLDALRRNIKACTNSGPDDYVASYEGVRFLRDLTVNGFYSIQEIMNRKYGPLDWANWYDQWGWAETASDEYVWPVELIGS